MIDNFNQKREEKSLHMEMLDEMIVKLNEKKYDIDDLYFKVLGHHPITVGEQANSVFYS